MFLSIQQKLLFCLSSFFDFPFIVLDICTLNVAAVEKWDVQVWSQSCCWMYTWNIFGKTGRLSSPIKNNWKIKWCKNYIFHTCWPPCSWIVWPVWKCILFSIKMILGKWEVYETRLFSSLHLTVFCRNSVYLSRLSNLSLNWGSLDDNGLWGACSPHHLGSDHLEKRGEGRWVITNWDILYL